jgi:DNA topoisomerase-3
MRLFIAEKPSLGRAIAQHLPAPGQPVGRPATHIAAGQDVVTWCFGHLLEMAEPEAYGPEYKRWSFESLPIFPAQWRLEPRKDAAAQIKTIRGLLKDCDEVVHAGDPDREGQLLVDELLEYLGNRKPVRRIWLAALDEASVRKALAGLRDNRDYALVKTAAELRQRGDWLVGMNLTRAYTLAGRRQGDTGVLSVGRVQTPTLALVVGRCLAIEQFVPKDFYTVAAAITLPQGAFTAYWKPGGGVPTDDEGRVVDRRHAVAVCAKAEGRPAQVTHYEAKEIEQAPPLPYSLSALQQAANKHYGLSAQAVLDAAQALYEAKATSYPRTDCPHLPESQWADARRVIAGLPSEYATLAAMADPSRRSKAYNDQKITAHHAIVPTGQPPGKLDGPLRQVYDLVVRAYLAQFFPPSRQRDTRIVLSLAGEVFEAAGTTPLEPGWKAIYGGHGQPEDGNGTPDGNPSQTLPQTKTGDTGVCQKTEVVARTTTPPAYFTEGTLIAAMTSIHRLVDDPELKKRLKETSGIGTEATRAGIIETLKKRSFITEKGRTLRDTAAGRALVQSLPEPVKSPGLTGLFEQMLKGVEDGTVTPERFMEQQTAFVTKYVAHAKANQAAAPEPAQAPICPECRQGSLRRIKGKKGFFWGCSRYQDGCKATFEDKVGKPAT